MLETVSRRGTSLHFTAHHATPLRNATQRNVLIKKGLKMFKTSVESQAEVKKLVAMLYDLSIGQTLTYAKASKTIGRNVQGGARSNLEKARRIVERESGARFATLQNQGIRRLATEEIPSIGAHARSKIHRLAKRGYRRLSGLSANDIAPAVQTQIRAERSQLGAIAEISNRRTHKKIDEAVTTVKSELPVAQILAMLAEQF